MKKTALNKDIIREIKRTISRFLSIFALMALASFAFVGLKSTGPDMRRTMLDYYEEYNMANIYVQCSYGINENDIERLKSLDGASDIEFGYSKDSFLNEYVVRINSKSEGISNYEIKEGRVPEKQGEVALDYYALHELYKIGDQVTFYNEEGNEDIENVKNSTFEIVGFVSSPEYINLSAKATTTLGTGKIDTFAVISKEDFDMEVYTIAKIIFGDMNNISDMDKYNELQSIHINEVKEILKNAPQEKLEQIKEEYAQIALDVQNNIEEVKAEIENLKEPKYIIKGRGFNEGYTRRIDNSNSIDELSNIFPVFLFAIAALVCLTTMTRMVEEQRGQIGILKALGYSNIDIMKKFIIYGFIASVLGTIVGGVIGINVLPKVIFNAYEFNSIFDEVVINIYPIYIIISLILSITCTVIVTVLVIIKDLKQKPSVLMRPKAPKSGSRIFLERIKFIWNRLNFNKKVAARNIFRYKKRMIMTIVGVAGCTGLIFTGFGLKDAIVNVVDMQYKEIINYDELVVYDETKPIEEIDNYMSMFDDDGNISSYQNISFKSLAVDVEENNTQSVYIISPEDVSNFKEFIVLNNILSNDANILELKNDGVIITEKLSELLNVKVGETITLQDENDEGILFKISGISKNYVGHYLYISPEYYKEVFGKEVNYNANLIKLIDHSDDKVKELSFKLLSNEITLSVQETKASIESINDTIEALNIVVLVLIVCASMLAFIVLYNLTNINVLERIRELSTIKVLGFYPKEVTMYVYRETMTLTIIGIIFGYGFGFFLHNIMVKTIPPAEVLFDKTVLWSNPIVSAGLTLCFSVIVMFVIHKKLKDINMIEALKSVE